MEMELRPRKSAPSEASADSSSTSKRRRVKVQDNFYILTILTSI